MVLLCRAHTHTRLRISRTQTHALTNTPNKHTHRRPLHARVHSQLQLLRLRPHKAATQCKHGLCPGQWCWLGHCKRKQCCKWLEQPIPGACTLFSYTCNACIHVSCVCLCVCVMASALAHATFSLSCACSFGVFQQDHLLVHSLPSTTLHRLDHSARWAAC